MIERRLEPYDLYEEDYEPEPLSDEDICRLEEEVFLTISDETLAMIYEELEL